MSRPKWIVSETPAGTAPATAAAGGDIGGTLPGGVTVTGIQGYPVDLAGIADGDVITWDAVHSKWVVSVPSGGITVSDEGTPLASAATGLNFTGAGVTASGTGATKVIDIPGISTVWAPLMVADLDGDHWDVLVDGDGNAIVMAE